MRTPGWKMRSRSAASTPAPSSSTSIDRVRPVSRHFDGHRGGGVAAGILDHRREDPLDDLGVGAQADRNARSVHERLDAPPPPGGARCLDRMPDGLARVRLSRASRRPRSARRRRVRRSCAPSGSRCAPIEASATRCSSLVRSRRSASSTSRVDARERCAQLVRHLGREALLVTEAVAEAREQRVERGREAGELVVGLTASEAPVGVVLAPVGGRGRHLRHRLERTSQDRAGCEHDETRTEAPRARSSRSARCAPSG